MISQETRTAVQATIINVQLAQHCRLAGVNLLTIRESVDSLCRDDADTPTKP